MTVARIADHSPDDPCIQPLIYQQDVLDVGNHWNRSTNKLKLPSDSIYFFHINAGTKPGIPVELAITGIGAFPGLTHLTSQHNGVDTFGRDIILRGTAGREVFVLMDETSDVYADPGQQTSFTAFDVQSYMSTVDQAIFSVARVSDESSMGRIMFETVLVDVGDNWQQTNSEYHVPVSGLYFFTASRGTPSGYFSYMWIRVNNVIEKYIYGHDTTSNNGRMSSGSFLVYLSAGDVVHVEAGNSIPQSDFRMQTSFSGFHYNPATGPTAWYASLDNILESYSEPIDPIMMTTSVDTDGAYSNGVYTVPRSGLYYILVDVVMHDGPFVIHVVLNDVYIQTTISQLSTHYNNGHTTNQAFLIELFESNTLKLIMEPNSSIYSNSYSPTSFTGLMLSEYQFQSPENY